MVISEIIGSAPAPLNPAVYKAPVFSKIYPLCREVTGDTIITGIITSSYLGMQLYESMSVSRSQVYEMKVWRDRETLSW